MKDLKSLAEDNDCKVYQEDGCWWIDGDGILIKAETKEELLQLAIIEYNL